MARWLPWVLVVAAVAAIAWLALPLLTNDGGSSSVTVGGDEGETGPRSASRLQGAGTAAAAAGRAPTGVFRIHGRVLGDDGGPVPEVPVRLEDQGREGATPEATLGRRIDAVRTGEEEAVDVASETVSGPDGTFVFLPSDAGRYRLRARPALPLVGSVSYAWLGRSRGAEVTLRVRTASPLDGRVIRGEDERPVLARLTAATRDLDLSYRSDPATTDAATGRFRIGDLPAGRWTVTVRIPGRLELSGLEVEVPHEGVWTVLLDEETGVAQGTVTDAGGSPVAGADVLVQTRGDAAAPLARAVARTDEQGSYTIPEVPAGRVVEVDVLRDGFLANVSRPPLASWSGASVKPGATTVLDVVLEAGAVIEGRVLDRDSGAPLEGAEVFALAPRSGDGPGVAPGTAAARSDTSGADGRYRIEGIASGAVLVVARHPTHYLPALSTKRTRTVRMSYGSAIVTVPHPDLLVRVPPGGRHADHDIRMAAGASVEGIVLGPDGSLCAGAAVGRYGNGPFGETYAMGYLAPEGLSPLATSDGDGRFAIRCLPPGEESVLVASRPGLVGRPSEPITPSAESAPRDLTLHLTEGATIEGRAVGPDGQGLPDVAVSAYASGWGGGSSIQVRSGPDGAFRIEGAPTGRVQLFAWASGWAFEQGPESTLENVEPGAVRSDVVLRLQPRVRVSGVLVDPDGKPVAGTGLMLRAEGGDQTSYGRTDEAGRFEFDAAPEGRVRLLVSRRGGPGGRETRIGEPFQSPAEGLRIVWTPPPRGVLEGTVVDAAGRPVPLCELVVEQRSHDEQFGYQPPNPQADEVLGGRFRRVVEGDPPYRIRVSRARDADGRPLNLRETTLTVASLADAPVTIRLEEGARVEGRVLGPDGTGIADVLVETPSTLAWTDSTGSFSLAGLGADGPTTVGVSPPDGFVKPKGVVIQPQDTELTVRLERSVSIRGVVLEGDGSAPTNAYVQVLWKTPDGRSGNTSVMASSVDGRFEIAGLPQDARATLTVNMWSPGRPVAPVTLSDVAAGSSNVEIRIGGGATVEGFVVDSDGSPFHEGWLVVKAAAAPDGPQGTYAQIRADGTFRVEGLARGTTYRLTLQRQARGPAPAPVDVVAPASGVRITVPAGRRIEGRLAGPVSPEGFTLSVRQVGGAPYASQRIKVAEDGSFAIEDVGDGEYELRAQKSGDGHYARLTGVRGGATGVELKLVEGVTLSGTLVDATGNAVAVGWIMVRSASWTANAQVTDGAFEVKGLPPGRYAVTAAKRGADGAFSGWTDVGEREAPATGVRLQLE